MVSYVHVIAGLIFIFSKFGILIVENEKYVKYCSSCSNLHHSVFICLADIIFCIYLYQRWIYRVDPKRVNEFGTSAEMLDQQQVADGQNGTVPAISSSADTDEAAPQATGDELGLSPEPTKSKAEKKKD